jgi:hypothetical protein
MTLLRNTLESWLETAQAKLSNGGVTAADLDSLRQALQSAQPRQRLLYLHARGPSVTAPIIGMAEHEPLPGVKDTIRTRTNWPYNTVQEAMIDGWQVIHFPQQMAPFDDRELDYAGYEFILQKIEEVTP